MTSREKTTIITIIVAICLVWILFRNWYKWNDAYDEREQGGTVEMHDGLKYLRTKE